MAGSADRYLMCDQLTKLTGTWTSSVKMFESISGECQTILALEKALKCLCFTTRKYKVFGLKTQKVDPKEDFFERVWVTFYVFRSLTRTWASQGKTTLVSTVWPQLHYTVWTLPSSDTWGQDRWPREGWGKSQEREEMAFPPVFYMLGDTGASK